MSGQRSSGGDTSNACWTWTDAANPYGRVTPTQVNDSGTMAAWLVRTFAAPGDGVRWDLRNRGGERIAPGVYVLRAETGQGTAKGKVIVR